MNVSALNRNLSAADLPLEKLAASTKIPEREKIAEVSRQFESVLLRQILVQAQKPLFQSSLVDGSASSNAIYQDLITQQLADRISHGGSFGFATVLNKQLAGQYLKKEPVALKPFDSEGGTPLKTIPEVAPVPPHSDAHPATHTRLRAQPGKRL